MKTIERVFIYLFMFFILKESQKFLTDAEDRGPKNIFMPLFGKTALKDEKMIDFLVKKAIVKTCQGEHERYFFRKQKK